MRIPDCSMAVPSWFSTLLVCVLLSTLAATTLAQLSDPVTKDEHVTKDNSNKFLARQSSKDKEPMPEMDEENMPYKACSVNLELRWQAEVSSSIYCTPLVADINRDGKTEVVVSSFVHYLEVLDGYDGDRVHGWPAQYRSSSHASPLLHDIDGDGLREILVADYNGEILSFSPFGEELSHYKITVPRLKVRRDWFVGLDPDHVDHQHPDIHASLVDTGLNGSHPTSPDGLLNLPTAEVHQHPFQTHGHGGHHSPAHHSGQNQEHGQAHHSAAPGHQHDTQPADHAANGQHSAHEGHVPHPGEQEAHHTDEHAQHAEKGQHPSEHPEPPPVGGSHSAAEAAGDHGHGLGEGHAAGVAAQAGHSGDQGQGQSHGQSARATGEEVPAGHGGSPGLEAAPGSTNQAPHDTHAAHASPASHTGNARHSHEAGAHAEPPAETHGPAAANGTATPSPGLEAAPGTRPAVHIEAAPITRAPAVLPAATTEQIDLAAGWERWRRESLEAHGSLTVEEEKRWQAYLEWRKGFRFPEEHKEGHAAQRRLLQADEGHAAAGGEAHTEHNKAATAEPHGELDEEGLESWDMFKEDEWPDYEEGEAEGEGAVAEAEHQGAEEKKEGGEVGGHGAGEDDEDEDEWADLMKEHDYNPDDYPYNYEDYPNEELWGDEDWSEVQHEADKEFIHVDAHILCTPVIADIDADGVDEMVVSTSYFFDKEYYDDPAHKSEVPEGLDLSKYIAGAVVVINLATRQMKWIQHLDLTTDATQFRAYIYSSPTVVDLDGDGRLEIIVGTSVGFIYCLNADGTTRKGFPLQMGEVQGQVVAGDINHDGRLEIVAADTRGNVAAFSDQGKELWERHVASLVAQGATFGDVNGDGYTEVVVGTSSGYIFVLDGRTGNDVGPFPVRTHGRVMAPVLLLDLHAHRPATRSRGGAVEGTFRGLHLIVLAFDGYLYAIDGKTACIDVVDIGETSYSMVLADNVDGGEDLDLVVTTMNGMVYCFQTSVTYHPLKAWPSQNQGRNVFFPRFGHEGIFLRPSSREFRDINRDTFQVQFEIVDSRKALSAADTSAPRIGPYQVAVWLLDHPRKVLVLNTTYMHAGTHTITVPALKRRSHAVLLLEMEDERRLLFHDEVALSFHMQSFRLLKWILALPVLIMAAALVARSAADVSGQELPSFSPARAGHLA